MSKLSNVVDDDDNGQRKHYPQKNTNIIINKWNKFKVNSTGKMIYPGEIPYQITKQQQFWRQFGAGSRPISLYTISCVIYKWKKKK